MKIFQIIKIETNAATLASMEMDVPFFSTKKIGMYSEYIFKKSENDLSPNSKNKKDITV